MTMCTWLLLANSCRPITRTWPDRLQVGLAQDLLLLDALAQRCECCCMLLQAVRWGERVYCMPTSLRHVCSSTLTAAGDTSELGWLMPQLSAAWASTRSAATATMGAAQMELMQYMGDYCNTAS
jgi:hypothetical protein